MKEAKEITQFERADLEHVEEWTQAAFPAEDDEKFSKREAANTKQTTQRVTAVGGEAPET